MESTVVCCCTPLQKCIHPFSNWKYSQDVYNFMDGRTPISQNLNGTTMSCLNYAKISCMQGTREILGCAVICLQPDGPRGFQKQPLSKEKGKRFGITQADCKALGQTQLSLAVVLVSVSAGMRATCEMQGPHWGGPVKVYDRGLFLLVVSKHRGGQSHWCYSCFKLT